jgi:hypothetical protein
MNDALNQVAHTTAAALLKQYGEDAAVIATLRAAEIAAMGDSEALAHWDQVIIILENDRAIGPLN